MHMTHHNNFTNLYILKVMPMRIVFLFAYFFQVAYRGAGDIKIMEKSVLSYSIRLIVGLLTSLLSHIKLLSYLSLASYASISKSWVGGHNV